MAPILPLVIAAIFVILLMRFINIRKSKDLMVVLGSLLGLFLGIGVNFLTQSIPQGNEKEFITSLIESNTGLIEAIGNKFPPSIWLLLPCCPGWQVRAFLLFIGLSLLLLAVLLWLGVPSSIRDIFWSRGARKAKAISVRYGKRAPKTAFLLWLCLREWKLFI